MAVVEDRAGSRGKLVMALTAIKLRTLLDMVYDLALAARAFNPFRPAKLNNASAAHSVIAELLNNLHQVHVRFDSGLGFAGFADSRIHI
jgi:hypothetical protein